MKFLLPLLAATLITTPAIAGERRVCGDVTGFHVCALDTDFIDTLQIDWEDGDQTSITVHCESGEYHRTGYDLDFKYIQPIVDYWCNT